LIPALSVQRQISGRTGKSNTENPSGQVSDEPQLDKRKLQTEQGKNTFNIKIWEDVHGRTPTVVGTPRTNGTRQFKVIAI
jgi:hypothetical protein